MEEIVYLNNEFLPREQAAISPFDHGFLYGFGVFETLRSYSGRFFRLSTHLERLYHSLEALRIDFMVSPDELEMVLYKLLVLNKLNDARVRITVSAGTGEAAPDPAPINPTMFITTRSQSHIAEEVYHKGYRAITASVAANRLSPLGRVKSCNYLNLLLARREAQAAGVQEALLLNDKDYFVEGSATNLFLVQNGKLLTPDLASGALPGVTRGVVLELASAMGLSVIQREISKSESKKAQEAFLTSSVIEVMPLVSIDGQPVGKGIPGEVTHKIMVAYRGLVQQETSILKKGSVL